MEAGDEWTQTISMPSLEVVKMRQMTWQRYSCCKIEKETRMVCGGRMSMGMGITTMTTVNVLRLRI